MLYNLHACISGPSNIPQADCEEQCEEEEDVRELHRVCATPQISGGKKCPGEVTNSSVEAVKSVLVYARVLNNDTNINEFKTEFDVIY